MHSLVRDATTILDNIQKQVSTVTEQREEALQPFSVIFIDEPELSLHVDWQRLLFPKLLSQSTNNQFIVATHSPFIYSKYPDKELLLDADRGDS